MGNKQQLLSTKCKTETEIKNKFPDDKDLFFTYVKFIGSGAFSKVFLIKNKKNKNDFYALKLMSKINLLLKNYGDEIYHEYLMLNSFKSDFICKIKFIQQDLNFIYIGIELCKYGDLRNILTYKKKLNYKESFWVMCNIVLMLEDLENNKIIHKDIKPDNILISDDGYLKLTDFGISEMINKENKFVKSGTLYYMAPENILGFDKDKDISDYYSIGIIFHEILTGKVL